MESIDNLPLNCYFAFKESGSFIFRKINEDVVERLAQNGKWTPLYINKGEILPHTPSEEIISLTLPRGSTVSFE